MTNEPIRYRLTFHDFRRHLVRIEATIPTARLNSKDVAQASGNPSSSAESIVLMMPTWTPGSYLIREFARQVESITVVDDSTNQSLAIDKVDKASWRVECNGASTIRVAYTLYCRELSVRTNLVDEEFAFLTGAATFITRADAVDHPHVVEIECVSQWPYIACSLPPESESDDNPVDWIHSFTRRAESFHSWSTVRFCSASSSSDRLKSEGEPTFSLILAGIRRGTWIEPSSTAER